MKKSIYVLIGIVAVIIVLIIVFASRKGQEQANVQSGEDNPNNAKVMTTEKMAETKEYKGFEISNVSFKVEKNTMIIEADVKNATEEDKDKEIISINILDKDGNTIASVAGSINAVKAGESTKIRSEILSNGEETRAYDIQITEKR